MAAANAEMPADDDLAAEPPKKKKVKLDPARLKDKEKGIWSLYEGFIGFKPRRGDAVSVWPLCLVGVSCLFCQRSPPPPDAPPVLLL